LLLAVVEGRLLLSFMGNAGLTALLMPAILGARVYFAYVSRRARVTEALPNVLYLLGGGQLLAGQLNLHLHPWTIGALLWGGLTVWTAYSLKRSNAVGTAVPSAVGTTGAAD
jgi:hypothetical protein